MHHKVSSEGLHIFVLQAVVVLCEPCLEVFKVSYMSFVGTALQTGKRVFLQKQLRSPNSCLLGVRTSEWALQ